MHTMRERWQAFCFSGAGDGVPKQSAPVADHVQYIGRSFLYTAPVFVPLVWIGVLLIWWIL